MIEPVNTAKLLAHITDLEDLAEWLNRKKFELYKTADGIESMADKAADIAKLARSIESRLDRLQQERLADAKRRHDEYLKDLAS